MICFRQFAFLVISQLCSVRYIYKNSFFLCHPINLKCMMYSKRSLWSAVTPMTSFTISLKFYCVLFYLVPLIFRASVIVITSPSISTIPWRLNRLFLFASFFLFSRFCRFISRSSYRKPLLHNGYVRLMNVLKTV